MIPDTVSKQVEVLLGDGTGQLVMPTGLIPTTGSEPRAVSIGNFDGDGVPDMLIGLYPDHDVLLFRGNGDGHFQVPQHIATASVPKYMAVGDIDKDGIDDFVVAEGSAGLTVFFGPCP